MDVRKILNSEKKNVMSVMILKNKERVTQRIWQSQVQVVPMLVMDMCFQEG